MKHAIVNSFQLKRTKKTKTTTNFSNLKCIFRMDSDNIIVGQMNVMLNKTKTACNIKKNKTKIYINGKWEIRK